MSTYQGRGACYASPVDAAASLVVWEQQVAATLGTCVYIGSPDQLTQLAEGAAVNIKWAWSVAGTGSCSVPASMRLMTSVVRVQPCASLTVADAAALGWQAGGALIVVACVLALSRRVFGWR